MLSNGAIVAGNDMLLNMSSSSDETLRELPKPYDISSAVSRVLRIDSSSGSSEVNAHRTSHVNLLTANEMPVSSNNRMLRHQSFCDYQSCDTNYLPLQLELEIADKTISALCDTFEDPTSSSPSNMAELDHLYTFLDNTTELEDLVPSPKKIPLPKMKVVSYSTSCVGPSSTRRRKSKRSLSYYDDSSPEHSPVSPVGALRPCGQPRNSNWGVSLVNSELWKRFDGVGTEMVITKTGRRMFPALDMGITGLDRDAVYSIKLNITPANSKRYKYVNSKWIPTGKAEKKVNYCEYTHPDSPNTGGYWMEKGLSFKHLKLTNNKNTKYDDQIILNSMQKYQPMLTVSCERDGVCQKFYFPESQFIAVTAYQNNQITQMKIENNPYARAFRDGTEDQKGGHCVRKTSRSSPSVSPAHTSKAIASVSFGFESEGTQYSADLFSDATVDIVTQSNPFSNSSLNYWADDNSLWNPSFITPPQCDSTSSFSEPYLQQTSRLMAQNDVSPVKGLCGDSSGEHFSLDSTVIVDIETVDDDDVFL